jgi:hypothetical protein
MQLETRNKVAASVSVARLTFPRARTAPEFPREFLYLPSQVAHRPQPRLHFFRMEAHACNSRCAHPQGRPRPTVLILTSRGALPATGRRSGQVSLSICGQMLAITLSPHLTSLRGATTTIRDVVKIKTRAQDHAFERDRPRATYDYGSRTDGRGIGLFSRL